MEEAGKRESRGSQKPRKDKGQVMATERDLYCIAWIAEQYAVRGDQLQRLLSRFPNPDYPFRGELIAKTTVRDQIGRWQRAGWVEYRRVLAGEAGYAWVTKKGLQLVDLEEIYQAREPASTRLKHLCAIAQLRLWLDQKYAWKSERRYRAEELERSQAKKGKRLGPIPDAVITQKNGVVAIEVELTAKKPEEIYKKLVSLVRHSVSRGNGYEKAFHAIWFYVSSERIKTLIEEAREKLAEDEQKRVAVVLSPMLQALQSASH
jgi:hypothetical protein